MQTNKGFTLLEMLITIMIICSCFILVIGYKEDVNLDYIYFMNEYLDLQSDSIVNKQRNDLINNYSSNRVYFNENGNVNKAQTITISKRNITIHLGNGYITYE